MRSEPSRSGVSRRLEEGNRVDVEGTQPRPAPSGNAIADYFKFEERGTNIATEAKAGVTTFMVMGYILFVNPLILSNAGISVPAAAAATALVAGLMSIAMGVFANAPIALAAGLGINGAVAFGLVLTSGLTPAGAMCRSTFSNSRG